MTKPLSEKKNVTILLSTGLDVASSKQSLEGTLVREKTGYKLSWFVPPEDRESIGSTYQILIDDASEEIRMIRSDDCQLEIVFRMGASTLGVLTLPQGQLSMDIFTQSIRIPDFSVFFAESEENARSTSSGELLLQMEYEIRFSDNESTQNLISLQIRLAI